MSVYLSGSEHMGVVKFFQFWCVFEIFQNKILEKRNSMHYDVVVRYTHLKYTEKQIEIIALKRASVQFSSITQSCSILCDPMDCEAPQASLSITTPEAYSNSCPLSRWCHPAISSSVVPFSCPQSLPASGSFQMSQFFTSGDQSIGVLASASVLPTNIQDWSPLGWIGWISLQSKGLSRVFSTPQIKSLSSLVSDVKFCRSHWH